MAGVINAEFELLSNANKILNYGESLALSLEAYQGILKGLIANGFEDKLIVARLTYIGAKAAHFQQMLNNLSTEIKTIVSEDVTAISEADKFEYQDGELEAVPPALSPLV